MWKLTAYVNGLSKFEVDIYGPNGELFIEPKSGSFVKNKFWGRFQRELISNKSELSYLLKVIASPGD